MNKLKYNDIYIPSSYEDYVDMVNLFTKNNIRVYPSLIDIDYSWYSRFPVLQWYHEYLSAQTTILSTDIEHTRMEFMDKAGIKVKLVNKRTINHIFE